MDVAHEEDTWTVPARGEVNERHRSGRLRAALDVEAFSQIREAGGWRCVCSQFVNDALVLGDECSDLRLIFQMVSDRAVDLREVQGGVEVNHDRFGGVAFLV